MAAPVGEPYEPPATSAAALSESERLLAAARASHQTFLTAAPDARASVQAARGAARNSDSWFRAQLAIADLEAARAELMIALADLDRLSVDAAVSGTQFADLAARRDEVSALADSQSALISAMLESLAP